MENRMSIQAIPGRYKYAVIPHAMVTDAAAAIEFYKSAFGALELFRLALPNGHIIHAELKIEDSVFMVGEASPPFSSPSAANPSSAGLHVYVKDVDAVSEQAVAAGAEILQPAQNMFYGDRQTMLRDPFGHIWVVLTRLEDLSEAEIVERANDFFSKMPTSPTTSSEDLR
jgi:PhnB protein